MKRFILGLAALAAVAGGWFALPEDVKAGGACVLRSWSDPNTSDCGKYKFKSLTVTGASTIGGIDLSTLTRGYIIRGDSSGAPAKYDANNSGQILVGDGTDIASVAVSGDATLSAAGALTIAANAVGSAEITGATGALSDLAVLAGRGYLIRGGAGGAPEGVDCSALGAVAIGDGTDITCDDTGHCT